MTSSSMAGPSCSTREAGWRRRCRNSTGAFILLNSGTGTPAGEPFRATAPSLGTSGRVTTGPWWRQSGNTPQRAGFRRHSSVFPEVWTAHWVATIAADAVGPGNVRCVMLPSDFTSPRIAGGMRMGSPTCWAAGSTGLGSPGLSARWRRHWPPCFAGPTAERPRRTSNPASGAFCSWRSPTSSANCC